MSLLLLVILSSAYTVSVFKAECKPASLPGDKYKNLKVLPKDISERQLDSIMNSYNAALKVSCDFCHGKAKQQLFGIPSGQEALDFAMDIPMKEEARKMIRLQIEINKNYFYHDSTKRPEFLNVVTCNTCHRGNPFPAYE